MTSHISHIFERVCCKTDDACKSVASLVSKGGDHKVALVHGTIHSYFRKWCSCIQHERVPGVSGKKDAQPLPLKHKLCYLANKCMCGQRGNAALTILSKLIANQKATHPRGNADARKQLLHTEVVVFLMGTGLPARGVRGRSDVEIDDQPDHIMWFLVAHVLQSPWEVMWLRLHTQGAAALHVSREEDAEHIKSLQTPTGPIELVSRDEYFTSYELCMLLNPQSLWEATWWRLLWSEKMVASMAPDRCEVVLPDAMIHTVYNPRRDIRKPKPMVDAWADMADESDGDAGDDEPSEGGPSEPNSPRPPSSHGSLFFSESEQSPSKAPSPSPSEKEHERRSPVKSVSSSSSSSSEESSHSSHHSPEPVFDNLKEAEDAAFFGLGAAHVRVKVGDLGWICYYKEQPKGYFLAVCRCQAHRERLACQVRKQANEGRKRGQGRPLGWLMAWLRRQELGHPSYAETRREHVHPSEPFQPPWEERNEAREELMMLDNGHALAEYEHDYGALFPEPLDFDP